MVSGLWSNNNTSNRAPLSSTPPSVQHISSTQKGHSFSAPDITHFHTKNSSVQHIPRFNTKNPSVPYTPQFNTSSVCWTEGFLVWNWGVFGVELRGVWNWGVLSVELRGVCWTEGFLVWNWAVCVELRGFWCETEGFWGLKRSGYSVWNWCVELRGVWNWGGPHFLAFV